jgi:hypothetical protein
MPGLTGLRMANDHMSPSQFVVGKVLPPLDVFCVARARQCDPIDTLARVLVNFPRLQPSSRKGATIPSNILRAP